MKRFSVVILFITIILVNIFLANATPNVAISTKASLAQSTSIQVPCYNAQNMPITALQAEIILDEQVGVKIDYNNDLSLPVKSFVATLFALDVNNSPVGFAAWEITQQAGGSSFLEINDKLFLSGFHKYAMVINHVEINSKQVQETHKIISQQATLQLTALNIDVSVVPNLINGEPVLARGIFDTETEKFCDLAARNAVDTCSNFGGIRYFSCNPRTASTRLRCVRTN